MRMITHLCLQKTLSSLLLSVRYDTFANICAQICACTHKTYKIKVLLLLSEVFPAGVAVCVISS